MTLFYNPDEPGFTSKFRSLTPTSGFCIFADISGSTEMKSQGLGRWAPAIYNTLSNVRSSLPRGPLKIVGDEIMYYLSDASLSGHGTALTVFAALASAAHEDEPYYRELRIGVAYCTDAYELSFVPNVDDVYGKDIDLTSRLVSVAGAREIVMNEGFVTRVRADYALASNKELFPEVPRIWGPWPQVLKGIAGYTTLYKLAAP